MSNRWGSRSFKRSISFTFDRDLFEQVCDWMRENGYARGDESAALKVLVRIAITGDPITAHLQDAKLRAYRSVVTHINTELSAFLVQMREQVLDSVRTTSREEAGSP